MYNVTAAAVLVLIVVGLLVWWDSVERTDPLSVNQVDETTMLDVVTQNGLGADDNAPATGVAEANSILLAQNVPGEQVAVAALTLREPGSIAVYRVDPVDGESLIARSPILDPGTYYEYSIPATTALANDDLIVAVLFSSTANVAAEWQDNLQTALMLATDERYALDADVVGVEPGTESPAILDAVEQDLPSQLPAS